MIARAFDWDTVQMPINLLDAHYRSFQNDVLPACRGKDISVIGMKALGGAGSFPKSCASLLQHAGGSPCRYQSRLWCVASNRKRTYGKT